VSASGLDRFYDVPDAVTARLHGGPFDGEERLYPAVLLESQVVARLEVMIPPVGLSLGDRPGPPRRVRRAVYVALPDDFGFFSRDDAGRVRFDFWGLQ
jgi:hypothetical protein